jgi:RNA polymerase sigma-70 factor (ECF subfamily)
VSISFNRKEKSRKEISMPFTETLIQFPDTKVQDEREHDLQTLEHFISQLKSFDKALILLYLEEKSSSEMAEILGISETNVTTRISRIKNALRQKFISLRISG